MPKVTKKSRKKSSTKAKRKLKTTKSSKKGSKRISKQTVVIDTYQSWINDQVKKGHLAKKEPKSKDVGIPADSMAEWLKRQPEIEKEIPPEVKLPMGSMDQWLQNQVTARLSMPEVEETSNVRESQGTEDGSQAQAETQSQVEVVEKPTATETEVSGQSSI